MVACPVIGIRTEIADGSCGFRVASRGKSDEAARRYRVESVLEHVYLRICKRLRRVKVFVL